MQPHPPIASVASCPATRPALPTGRRIRSEAVWAEVRTAWEGGETARAVAKRYDVGVPALWKRREAESWARPETRLGPIEPADGWERYAERELAQFEARLEATRTLAQDLAKAMAGGRLTEAPLWHLGFLLAWRAEHLGAEVAATDRAAAVAKDQPWVEAIWDADGCVRSVWDIDQRMIRLYRDTWRGELGLPDGAAPDYP